MFNRHNTIIVLLSCGIGIQDQDQDHSRMDHKAHSATADTVIRRSGQGASICAKN